MLTADEFRKKVKTELKDVFSSSYANTWFHAPQYVRQDVTLYTLKGNYAVTIRYTFKGTFVVKSEDTYHSEQRFFYPYISKRFRTLDPALEFTKQILVGMNLIV